MSGSPTAMRGATESMGAALQRLLDGVVARGQAPHAVLAVASVDGMFRWAGAAGAAHPDGGPLRVDSPFYAASVTKLYTAAIVLKLQERGRLDIDEPIASYLPHELIGGLHQLKGVDHTPAITVRHLLAHTSGLPDYFGGRPKGGRSLFDRLVHTGDEEWDVHDVVRTVRDELTPRFSPQPVEATRQKAHYSDTNYQLLGAIAEAVTGMRLHDVYAELLFQPLGLARTYLHGHGERPEPLDRPATVWFKSRPLHLDRAMASFAPDGGVVSTAEDMLAFMGALVRGEVFDDPATFERMQQRWNRIHFPFEYGLGVLRFRMPRAMSPAYAVPALVGHHGASGSWLYHCPELDVLLAGTLDQAAQPSLPYRLLPRALRILSAERR